MGMMFIKFMMVFLTASVFGTNASKANVAGAKVQDIKVQKIEKIFNDLNKDTMHLLYDFYANDGVLMDPLGKYEGIEAIRSYYANLYKNVQMIRFDFSSHVCDKSECVSMWTMHLQAKNLNGGNPIAVIGNSHIRFNEKGKVYYHRDYFDMGEFIYEYIPVLKNIISYIKKALKQ